MHIASRHAALQVMCVQLARYGVHVYSDVAQVLGLDVSKGMLLVYDGNKAEVYKVESSRYYSGQHNATQHNMC